MASFIVCQLAYFAKSNTIYKAYQHRFRSNKLSGLFALVITEYDLEWVFVDGTCIKKHQHSSGRHEAAQSISKSIAGRAIQIHLAVDFYGTLITFRCQTLQPAILEPHMT